MAKTGLNFLPRQDRLRLLQMGTITAVLGCAVMVGVVLRSPGPKTATLSDAVATPTGSTTVPDRTSVRPKAISENKIVSSDDGEQSDTVRYYERETGKAFSVNLRTLKTDILSDVKQSGLIRAYWLPNSTKVITEVQNPSGIGYRSFDFSSKATVDIGSDINTLAVSPDGRQLAYMKPTKDASELFVSDSHGKNPRKLLSTRAQEVLLDWPAKGTLSMASRRPDRTGTDLSVVDLAGSLVVMMSNRENLEYTWSNDGTRLLFSYYTPKQGVSLWYRAADSGPDIPIGLATSARKCAWHDNAPVITCGVPAKSSLGGSAPADRSATVDDIVTVDLSTGEQKHLYSGTGTSLIGVIDPLVSSSEKYFAFTNLFDQRLYEFPL